MLARSNPELAAVAQGSPGRCRAPVACLLGSGRDAGRGIRRILLPRKSQGISPNRNWWLRLPEVGMIDFSTQYLGLKLSGPIVVSSTPLSESIDNVRRMEDSGASAIVLHSLFEEQLALSRGPWTMTCPGARFLCGVARIFTRSERLPHDAGRLFGALRKSKAAVKIPILGSLNGATPGGWVRFAKDMEQPVPMPSS